MTSLAVVAVGIRVIKLTAAALVVAAAAVVSAAAAAVVVAAAAAAETVAPEPKAGTTESTPLAATEAIPAKEPGSEKS